ncbi:MAG: hypothetical protein V7K48_21885 [Nostoc sp.]
MKQSQGFGDCFSTRRYREHFVPFGNAKGERNNNCSTGHDMTRH